MRDYTLHHLGIEETNTLGSKTSECSPKTITQNTPQRMLLLIGTFALVMILAFTIYAPHAYGEDSLTASYYDSAQDVTFEFTYKTNSDGTVVLTGFSEGFIKQYFPSALSSSNSNQGSSSRSSGSASSGSGSASSGSGSASARNTSTSNTGTTSSKSPTVLVIPETVKTSEGKELIVTHLDTDAFSSKYYSSITTVVFLSYTAPNYEGAFSDNISRAVCPAPQDIDGITSYPSGYGEAIHKSVPRPYEPFITLSAQSSKEQSSSDSTTTIEIKVDFSDAGFFVEGETVSLTASNDSTSEDATINLRGTKTSYVQTMELEQGVYTISASYAGNTYTTSFEALALEGFDTAKASTSMDSAPSIKAPSEIDSANNKGTLEYEGSKLLRFDASADTWTSSNTAVATVSAKGEVSVVGVGKTLIGARNAGKGSNNGSSWASYLLTITPRTIEVVPTGEFTRPYNAWGTGGDVIAPIGYELSNTLEGEEPGVEGVLSRDEGSAVGTYAVTLGSLALVDTDTFTAGNYTLKLAEGYEYTISEYVLSEDVAALSEGGAGYANSHSAYELQAPEGYAISLSEDPATFAESVVINTEEYGDDGALVPYYLKYIVDYAEYGPVALVEHSILIDMQKPVIDTAGITFTSHDGTVVDYQEGMADGVSYGYYFKESTILTVPVTDEGGSGLASVTAAVVPNDRYGRFEPLGTVAPNDPEDPRFWSVQIPADFRGQVSIYAQDGAGNSTQDTPIILGIITETPEAHEEDRKTAHVSAKLPKTSYKDAQGLPLYGNAEGIVIPVEVSDNISGIRRVEWETTAYGTTEYGAVDVSNTGEISNGGWTVDDKNRNANLVTALSGSIAVAVEANGIELKLRMIDRAGNVTEHAPLYFSIDKTNPTISVLYTNDNFDSGHYYKEPRSATITVQDVNFTPKGTSVTILTAHGRTTKATSWTPGENNTWTTTVSFIANNDYQLRITCTDLAGHRNSEINYNNATNPTAFTVDTIAPTVTVVYDNNEVENVEYYKEKRSALIIIEEHNFDAKRVSITGTAADGETTLMFPELEGWMHDGDLHAATIDYDVDARYTFTISVTDKAGNVSEEYAPETFVIDTTAPTLEISGVADMSANNDVVQPIVSFADSNFSAEGTSIELSGANHGSVVPQGTSEATERSSVFTFNDFERIKQTDDFYTLHATIVDLAGNLVEQTIQFSVNRFGSVYVFDEELQGILNTYVDYSPVVRFREINVDSIDPETVHVQLSANSSVLKLDPENEDYSFTEVENSDAWKVYEYVLPERMFSADASYQVAVLSEDRASNINENIAEVKEAEISFAVDKTPPVIVSDVKSGQSYDEVTKPVNMTIKDNLKLEDVEISLNGAPLAYEKTGENYKVNIPESESPQSLVVTASDAAGNITNDGGDNILVSTNWVARWMHNTLIFVLSLIGIGVLAFAIAIFVLWKTGRLDDVKLADSPFIKRIKALFNKQKPAGV